MSNKSIPEVESLGMTVRFDRMFDIAKVYPAPGAFLISTSEGEEINFDFNHTASYRKSADAVRLVGFELDKDYSESAKALTKETIDRGILFKEIFIYTGEEKERPIPTEVVDIQFFFNDGTFIRVPQNAICAPSYK